MWHQVAHGPSPDKMQETSVLKKLPHNMPFKVVMRLSVPVAPFFDAFGAEHVAKIFYNQSGAILEDVEADGWWTIIMHFKANAVQLVPFLAVLGIVAAGIVILQLFTDVDVLAWLGAFIKYGAIALVAVGFIGIVAWGRKLLPGRG